MKERKFWHYCEVCGKKEFITAKEAFDDGWDYPPEIFIEISNQFHYDTEIIKRPQKGDLKKLQEYIQKLEVELPRKVFIKTQERLDVEQLIGILCP